MFLGSIGTKEEADLFVAASTIEEQERKDEPTAHDVWQELEDGWIFKSIVGFLTGFVVVGFVWAIVNHGALVLLVGAVHMLVLASAGFFGR